MALRDYLDDDLDIFIDSDEFATSHTINGTVVNAVIDDDLCQERQQSLNDVEGYFPATISYHIAATFFTVKPKPNSIQTFDGKPYRVGNITEDDGMYYVSLYDCD
jgi:hypothetical protein